MTTETITDRRWTWDDLIQVEPRLDDLYRSVPRTVRMYLLPGRHDLRDVVGFVERFSDAWSGARSRYVITEAIQDALDDLVGWHCWKPEIKTAHAWDIANSHITDLVDAEELLVKAEVDAWLVYRPSAEDGPAWDDWLLHRPWFDSDATYQPTTST